MKRADCCRWLPRRSWLVLFIAGGWLTASVVASAIAAERPDIVVFLTDDLGCLDTAPYGGNGIRTPRMQRLADAGLTFDRAYVASPSCAPSRAALLTGLMPARNGAEPNHSRPRPDLKKWPAWFQELGYEVVASGRYRTTGTRPNTVSTISPTTHSTTLRPSRPRSNS